MTKILKWIAIISAVLIVLIVVTLLLIPMFVDVARFKPLIEERVSKATGRPFTVGNDIKLSLFPWAGLTFSDLSLGNPQGFAEKDFIAVKSLEARLKLMPLVFRDIQVQRFVLNEPRIVLVKSKQGLGNWQMGPQKAAPQAGSSGNQEADTFELPVKDLAVGEFVINNGAATWIDHTKGLRKSGTGIDLRLKDVSLDQPVKVFFSGRLDGRLLSLTGTVGPVGRQFGKAPIGLDISLSVLEEIKMKLKGQVESPLTNPIVDLNIDVAEFSAHKVFAALGQPVTVNTTDPKALSRLALSAGIRVDQTGLVVSDGKIKLDNSTASLRLKIADYRRPDLTFDLAIDKIDADRYLPPESNTGPGKRQSAAAKSMDSSTKTGPSPAPGSKPFFNTLSSVDGRLKAGSLIINRRTIDDILLTLNGKTGLIKLALKARLKEGPLAVNGNIGPYAADAGRQTIPLSLAINAIDHLKLHTDGKVIYSGPAPAVEMVLKVDEFSPRKLMAALGQPFPFVTPDPGAINRAALSVNLKAAADSFSISDGNLTLDESKIKVAVRAANIARPDINFDFAVDQINLDRYLPAYFEVKSAADERTPQKDKSGGLSGDSGSAYDILRRLIVAGQLQAGKLTVNDVKLQNIRLKISGKNGLFTVDPLNMDLYQGKLAGKGRFDVQQKEPAGDVNVVIENVQIGPLLKDAAGQDILEGSTQALFNLTMKGDTDKLIRQTLNGQGEIKFNDGAIKGFDLAAMARSFESALGLGSKDVKTVKRPRTDFTELFIPFTISNGIAGVSKANMKSPFIRLEASGKADLTKETLDFYLDPKAVATIKGQGDEKTRSGILVPIIVSGTFLEVEIRPDLKRIITQQIDQGVLESEPLKKILDKKEMKQFEEPAKQILKDIFKKP